MSEDKEFIPTIYLIRHGKTALNDPTEERIRGWSDIPISREGHEGIELAAKKLAEKGIYRIVSSDLQRAMLTAKIIAEKTGISILPDRSLRPWDLGKLQGELVSKVKDKMAKYQAHPDIKVPDGESFNEFLNRWNNGLQSLMTWVTAKPDKPLVGVVHSRNMLSLDYLLTNGKMGIPVKGGPEPGEIVVLEDPGTGWERKML